MITCNPDWQNMLREAVQAAQHTITTSTQQDTLNFESPGAFFSGLNQRRWALLRFMLGRGTVGVRELSRLLERDIKGVHTDTSALVSLGLLHKDSKGALCCPYKKIYVDMELSAEPTPAPSSR